MHKQAYQDCDEVHAELFSQVDGVMHVKDLSSYQEYDAKGEIPGSLKKTKHQTLFKLVLPPALLHQSEAGHVIGYSIFLNRRAY